jgi:hypothetical protein
MNTAAKILILSSIFMLYSCDVRYRYPCQDPKNINNIECQKETCEISRECPEINEGRKHE